MPIKNYANIVNCLFPLLSTVAFLQFFNIFFSISNYSHSAFDK